MTQLPFITNQPTTSGGGKPDSVFRSAGQTKQYPPRPHITTAKPQGSGTTKTSPQGGKSSK